MPDMSILFDISPEVGIERINKNSQREVNRLDLETLDFHNKVREGYDIVYQNNKDRMVKINAEESIDRVFDNVKNIISNLLSDFGK